MKKILLLFIVPFVLISLSAQITQCDADSIVKMRMENETKPHLIYAKEEVQTEGFTVTTTTGEILELEYPAWVYYVNYTEEPNGKYLIVKENNGNLLEVNTKNDGGPEDLEEWREVIDFPINIPFTEYSLEGTLCQWKNLNYDETVLIINGNEELENYISCTEGSYPPVDFLQYTLLLASGKTNSSIETITIKELLQIACNKCELNMDILIDIPEVIQSWCMAIIVEKTKEENYVGLNITYEYTKPVGITIAPDKVWHIEHGMPYGGYPCVDGGGDCYCFLRLDTVKMGEIKIFNGKKYYELLRTHPYQQWEVVTYFREDDDGKVFFYYEDCDKEYLMYDFNLEVGDEVVLVDPRIPHSHYNYGECEFTVDDIFDMTFTVIETSEIEYNYVTRKMLKLKHTFWNYYDIWVEGIGCMRGIYMRRSLWLMGGVSQLKDCYDLDELIFENDNPEYNWCP